MAKAKRKSMLSAVNLVELIRQANAIAECELDGETIPPTKCVMVREDLWRQILEAAGIADQIGDDWQDDYVWQPTDEAFQGP